MGYIQPSTGAKRRCATRFIIASAVHSVTLAARLGAQQDGSTFRQAPPTDRTCPLARTGPRSHPLHPCHPKKSLPRARAAGTAPKCQTTGSSSSRPRHPIAAASACPAPTIQMAVQCRCPARRPVSDSFLRAGWGAGAPVARPGPCRRLPGRIGSAGAIPARAPLLASHRLSCPRVSSAPSRSRLALPPAVALALRIAIPPAAGGTQARRQEEVLSGRVVASRGRASPVRCSIAAGRGRRGCHPRCRRRRRSGVSCSAGSIIATSWS